MTENSDIYIQVRLSGNTQKMYEEMKEESGIKNHADTIRYFIKSLYILRSKNG